MPLEGPKGRLDGWPPDGWPQVAEAAPAAEAPKHLDDPLGNHLGPFKVCVVRLKRGQRFSAIMEADKRV